MLLRVATYNVHGWVGRDGKRSIERIASVVNELDADLVALQEVDERGTEDGEEAPLDALARLTNREGVRGPTLFTDQGGYGNALLVRPTLTPGQVHLHDISYFKREPRGVIQAIIPLDQKKSLHVFATHLGLKHRERRAQFDQLADLLRTRAKASPHSEQNEERQSAQAIVIVLGDFNEWTTLSRHFRGLESMGFQTETARTFPAHFPLLRLDRILVCPGNTVMNSARHDTQLAIVASDHRPLVVELDL